MFWVDTSTATGSLPAPKPVLNASEAYCTDGNPGSTPLATQLDADWFNMIQGELLNVVTFAGLTPSKIVFTQLLTAIQAIINADIAALDLGQASTKGVTDNSQTKVVSASGAFTIGHLLVAKDASGTAMDGGAPYSLAETVSETAEFTPGAQPGLSYRTTTGVTVNLDPTGLPTGWFAFFEIPIASPTANFLFQPTALYTLDGASARTGWGGTRVGILWNGAEFETFSGEYVYRTTVAAGGYANGGTITLNHEFGSKDVGAEMWAVAAPGQSPYTAGQQIKLGPGFYDGQSGGNFCAIATSANTTVLQLGSSGLSVLNGSGSALDLTPADWSLVILLSAK